MTSVGCVWLALILAYWPLQGLGLDREPGPLALAMEPLLVVVLLEMGLSADLNELERRIAADPAFLLQELKRRALAYSDAQA